MRLGTRRGQGDLHPSDANDGPTAIGADRLAGDEGRLVRTQEGDHGGIFVGVAEAAQRHGLGTSHHGFQPVLFDRHLSHHAARRDRVDGDVVGRELLGPGLGQTEHGGFRRRVGRAIFRVAPGHRPHGGDVDDTAVVPFLHAGHDSLGQEEVAADMDVEHTVEEFRLDRFDALTLARHSAVVDQDIDMPELGLSYLDMLRHGLDIGDVLDDDEGPLAGAADQFGCLLGPILVDVVDHDIGTAMGHQHGMGAPHATTGAGDKRNLACK